MAKTKSGKAYKVEIAGNGVHRINGIVREVTDAGVTIDVKQPGRQVRLPTTIPMADVIAHTGEGAGFVIANSAYALEPFAGNVTSEDETGITITDSEGVEITFPSGGRGGAAKFINIADDDRSLNRSAVDTKILRLAENEDGGGRKAKKKSADSGKASAKKKSGKRRSAK